LKWIAFQGRAIRFRAQVLVVKSVRVRTGGRREAVSGHEDLCRQFDP